MDRGSQRRKEALKALDVLVAWLEEGEEPDLKEIVRAVAAMGVPRSEREAWLTSLVDLVPELVRLQKELSRETEPACRERVKQRLSAIDREIRGLRPELHRMVKEAKVRLGMPEKPAGTNPAPSSSSEAVTRAASSTTVPQSAGNVGSVRAPWVEFSFTVGHAFRKYESHPITIPRRCYEKFEAERLGPGTATVLPPDGQRREAKIYRGENNWGSYYQVRTLTGRHAHGDPLNDLPLKTRLRVRIGRSSAGVEVHLVRA